MCSAEVLLISSQRNPALLASACLFFIVWDWATIEHIEEVKMIMLNRANRVLGVAHNHPSGNLVASDADKRITQKVKEALKLVDIELLHQPILTYKEKYATVE